jgi:hypothetical protein
MRRSRSGKHAFRMELATEIGPMVKALLAAASR